MRNLKKFLALVLAMMMCFSLMVTANAATGSFSDSESVTKEFQEAVEVLAGMGVLKGDDGKFMPTTTLDRAQAAAIMYRIVTGDAKDENVGLYKYYGGFDDVPSDAWYAGYVGYCANAGIIKGDGAGHFNPGNEVTGYEILTMLLRAVGYTNLSVFSGADWCSQVASGAYQLGILNNVNATRYGGTLYKPAPREVVASVTFQAIQLPQFINGSTSYWTSVDGVLTVKEYETLGEKWFGLTNVSRIVVGNQATGESCTLLGNEPGTLIGVDAGDSSKTVTFDYSEYAYPGATVPAASFSAPAADNGEIPAGIKLNYKSDLSLFGHEVNVWYNNKANSGGAGLYKAYAVTDGAALSKVVQATSTSTLASTASGDLGKAAKDAGFASTRSSDTYYLSASFSRIGGGLDTVANGSDPTPANTSTVFVLISNNPSKKVDVVIPVVCEVGEIDKVNNQASTKTWSLKNESALGLSGTPGTTDKQSLVMNPEAIKLGNTVVATKITQRTNTTTAQSVYWLDTPTKQVEKEIVSIGTGTDDRQTITCSDGSEYKRTIINDSSLRSGDTNVKTLVSGQTTFAKYVITLDMQGNWLNAVRAYDNNFVYGTYLDWSTSLGSGSFTYRLIGVDLDGKMVEKDITGWKDSAGVSKTLGTLGQDVQDVGIPYRDDMSTTGVYGRPSGAEYQGFIVNGKTASNADADLETVSGIQSFGADTLTGTDFQSNISNTLGDGTDELKITAADLKLGVKLIPEKTSVNLYLTENTKFIVVSGYGTGTQSIKTYDGLTKFLGESGSVKIEAADNAEANEILYTSAPYVYANTGATAREVKTIFIPSGCVTRTGTSSMYYFPKESTVVDSNDPTVHLFTAYQNGEKVPVWINNAGKFTIEGNITAGSAFGSFQNLEPTSNKASDGRTIYKLAAAPTDGAPGASAEVWTGRSYAGLKFMGTTNNGLSCLLSDDNGVTNKLAGTANVKVVNLVSGYTIKDISDLNDVASVKTVTVDVAYAAKGSVQIATIYVVKIA